MVLRGRLPTLGAGGLTCEEETVLAESTDVVVTVDGRVAHLALSKPTRRNALDLGGVDRLARAFAGLGDRTDVDVVVLRGEGQDFCAGAELGDLHALLTSAPADRSAAFERGLTTHVHPLLSAIRELPQPLVVSAQGHAVGLGAALVLMGDMVVLSEDARLSLPQAVLGHTLDHGESWLLPRRLGHVRSMELALLGGRLAAHDAQRWGLANLVVPLAELTSCTDALIEQLLRVPRASLLGTKKVLVEGHVVGFSEALGVERATASACAATPGFVEALSAVT